MTRKPKEIRYVLMTKSFDHGIVQLPQNCIVVKVVEDFRFGKQKHIITYLEKTSRKTEEIEQKIEEHELLPEPETTKNTTD